MKNSIILAFLLSVGILASGCSMAHKHHSSCCNKKESCTEKSEGCKKGCAKCKDASDCKACKDCGDSKCAGGECDVKDEPKADAKTEVTTPAKKK